MEQGSLGLFGLKIDTLFGLPWDNLGWPAFWTLLGAGALLTLSRSIKDVYHHILWKTKGISADNSHKKGLLPQLITNFLAPSAWISQVTFMAHLSKIFATQFWNASFNFIRGINVSMNSTYNYFTGTKIATVDVPSIWGGIDLSTFSGDNFPVMILAAVMVGLAAGGYRNIAGWLKHAIGHQYETVQTRRKSTLKWSLAFASVGLACSLIGLGMAGNVLFTFAVVLSFAHGSIHSWRSQEGGLGIKEKKYPIFDIRELARFVRNKVNMSRTLYSPSIDPVEPMTSKTFMVYLSEGCNWILTTVLGPFTSAMYKKGMEMIINLMEPEARRMRRLIKDGYERVKQAQTRKEAIEEAAKTYEELAFFFEDDNSERIDINDGNPRCLGNLRSISGLDFLRDHSCIAGIHSQEEGTENERQDQDFRVHGEFIRFAAVLLRQHAARLRKLDYKDATLDSVKATIKKRLDNLYNRAYPHIDVHPARFFTNILPDSYMAKQFVIDLCSQVMADFIGCFDTVVIDENGEVQMWAIPMRVVKNFKENYRDIETIDSRDEAGEDLRFEWYPREEGDIGDSLCEIKYIDNLAHFQKYERLGQDSLEFLAKYPTAEVLEPPKLEMNSRTWDPLLKIWEDHEFYDVVYKNGMRQRVYGDGSSRMVHPASDRPEATLPQEYARLLMLPGTERHEFVADRIDEVLDGIAVKPALLKRLAHGDVPYPHNWGGSLSRDPLIGPRWRFMYPTEFTSISDADQMDLMVTNLRLYFIRSNPALRIMTLRPEEVDLPFSPDIIDKEGQADEMLMAGVGIVWMTMRVKLADGRVITMPLNMSKENERTFKPGGIELWRYIDENTPVELTEEGKLKITYRKEAMEMPTFAAQASILEEVPVPIEMQELVDKGLIAKDQDAIMLDPVRYGDTGGPIPVIDFMILRRKDKKTVTDSTRTLEMSDHIAQLIISGNAALPREDEVDHMEACGSKTAKDFYPWTDKFGYVHMKLSEADYKQLKPWLARVEWHGARPQQEFVDGELVMHVDHFRQFCHETYWEMSYRRYERAPSFIPYFDPQLSAPVDVRRAV